jgi:hypothetical protein
MRFGVKDDGGNKMNDARPRPAMKRAIRGALIFAVVIAGAWTAVQADARSLGRSDAAYVQNHLIHYWQTSDGEAYVSATCDPWWHHGGHFVFEYGEWFGTAWNCRAVDDVNRVFWLHVRTRTGSLTSVVESSCNDNRSQYACP